MIERRLWLTLLALLASWGAPPRAMTADPAAPRADPVAHLETTLGRQDAPPLPLRLSWPRRAGRLPVILFSHGAYSSNKEYDAILDRWASHGYIVIAPTHRDSTTLGTVRGHGDPRFLPWRLEDCNLLLSRLAALEDSIPELAGRVDSQRIAATGHSFGGLVAQTLGGATLSGAATHAPVSYRDARVRAVLIISGAGALPPILGPANFAALTLPTLVSAGTADLDQVPGVSGYNWRRQPFYLSARGDKYLLTLQGADHYLGGRIGRSDIERNPSGTELLARFNDVSLDFLDAYLRGSESARRRLESAPGVTMR
jgi:predicted dienelactone hydrolase